MNFDICPTFLHLTPPRSIPHPSLNFMSTFKKWPTEYNYAAHILMNFGPFTETLSAMGY